MKLNILLLVVFISQQAYAADSSPTQTDNKVKKPPCLEKWQICMEMHTDPKPTATECDDLLFLKYKCPKPKPYYRGRVGDYDYIANRESVDTDVQKDIVVRKEISKDKSDLNSKKMDREYSEKKKIPSNEYRNEDSMSQGNGNNKYTNWKPSEGRNEYKEGWKTDKSKDAKTNSKPNSSFDKSKDEKTNSKPNSSFDKSKDEKKNSKPNFSFDNNKFPIF